MELYGVHHGGDYHFGGLSLAKMEVEPSYEMLEAIETLPKGSVIGIEAVDPQDLEDNPDNLAFGEEDLRYWQEIADVCQDSGHTIAYLDSFDIHKRAAQKRIDLRGLENTLERGKYVITPGQERTIAELIFSLGSQISYLHNVAREDHIIKKIDEARPAMAVVGLAHADYLMLNPDLLNRFEVAQYWRVLLDAPYITLGSIPLLGESMRVSQYPEQSPPDQSALRERELTTRTYHAATLGRIAVGFEPAWIGSWEPSNRPYGLFEVYPSSATEGKIEDRLGTAGYTGEFNEDTIVFTKRYMSTTTLDPSAVLEDVIYEAHKSSDDEYRGTWITYGVKGEFILRRGSYLYDPPDTDFGQQKLF